MSKYVSQWGPGWYDYKGPNLSPGEEKKIIEIVSQYIPYKDGKAVEGFRYYEGLPDDIGR